MSVCDRVCVLVGVYLCVFVLVCVCLFMSVCVYVGIYVCVCFHVGVCVSLSVSVSACTFVCILCVRKRDRQRDSPIACIFSYKVLISEMSVFCRRVCFSPAQSCQLVRFQSRMLLFKTNCYAAKLRIAMLKQIITSMLFLASPGTNL